MKKLNALVAAISFGLTASFAALPVTSAHSNHLVSNALTMYTTRSQQNYPPIRHHGPAKHHYPVAPFSTCEPTRIYPAGGTASVPLSPTTLTAPVLAGTLPGPTATVPGFQAPSNCSYALSGQENVTGTFTLSSTGSATATVACQWADNGQLLGQPAVATLVAIGSGTITVTASTSDVAFAPPTTVRPINDNFTKQCQVTSFTASSPGTTFGNVSVTLTGYGVQGQPGATSLSQIAGFPYINGNGPYGNASRSIKHIINH